MIFSIFAQKKIFYLRLATKKYFKNESTSLLAEICTVIFSKWVVRFSFDRSKIAVRNLETVKTGDNILRVIKVESWKRRKIEPDGEKGYQSF